MILVSALLTSLILMVLGILHFYWAMGGALGMNVVVPTDGNNGGEGALLFRPGPVITLMVGVLLCGAGLLVAMAADFLPLLLPSSLVSAGMWILALSFSLRALGDFRYVGFFKRVRHTSFATWDYRLYSPLCLFLAANLFYIVLS